MKNKIKTNRIASLTLAFILSVGLFAFGACSTGGGLTGTVEEMTGTQYQVSTTERQVTYKDAYGRILTKTVTDITVNGSTVTYDGVLSPTATEQEILAIYEQLSGTTLSTTAPTTTVAPTATTDDDDHDEADDDEHHGHGNSAFGHRQGDEDTRTKGRQNNEYGHNQHNHDHDED
ncbi:MAG: hypothetical protein OEZ36_03210 [Spirochaetota bacterium]|nr:hypothetical protein [Spirochaetota bacterium]